MNFKHRSLIVAAILVLFPCLAEGAEFIAYSLNAAERILKESSTPNIQVREIAGMTHPAGMVYDEMRNDLIIVGKVFPAEQKITLDDFVVSLRAKFQYKMCLQVSIDKTPETQKTRKQAVKFEGGIAETQVGMDLFRADVLLKKIGLGKVRADIWGVRSYFDMYADHWQETGDETSIESRFWFIPSRESCVAGRQGVAVLKELKICVLTEVLASTDNKLHRYDQIGDQFAEAFTNSYTDISAQFSELKRLNTIFKLVGIVEALDELSKRDPGFRPRLNYWLRDYKVRRVETPTSYPLLISQRALKNRGKKRTQTIDGGIRLENLMSDLRDGVATALRDIVILSRPEGNPLVWRVPLEGWSIPDTPEMDNDASYETDYAYPEGKPIGCSLGRTMSPIGKTSSAISPVLNYHGTHMSSYGKPAFQFSDTLSFQRYSNIGGVMLGGIATISGDAKVDLTRGNFSFIVDGENARLSPEVFRKFLTVLWAVYYGEKDPGISIDPIAPGIEKHLVRYIGKVINLDLGRIMREADYLMKKWAVGTERPNIPGFMNPDDISARRGNLCFGWSRFWFVPETMKFKSGGDMLLFDDGKMTLKTESMLRNHGKRADPANEKFAKFFTENYDEIAEKYPVYKELFEYAKLVSLAKYLKEKGVPLYWFLMANKDLVITEDSPGTVDALAKGSDHFRGITIEGGVDLGFEGNYVYDESAVKAIKTAISKVSTNDLTGTSLSPKRNVAKPVPRTFSFDLGKESYTVIPQHSLTSGKDRRGIRYQTDLALRQNGQPGLELVRYYNPTRKDGGEFGNGWHLLIPYRIKPAGDRKREFLNAMIPEKMALVNLLTGEEEMLSFSTDRYSVAGYVPEELGSSQIIGLFLLSDATYRLADKLGNEFWFDQAGYLTDMIFSKNHHFRIEYLSDRTTTLEWHPYRIGPADNKRMEFLNTRIPERMRVKDLVHGDSEDLVFSDEGAFAGYVPLDAETSRFKFLAIMSDASFRLLDNENNETLFDPAGRFDGLVASSDRPMVKSISLGTQRVDFSYTINKSGKLMIASARLSDDKKGAEPMYKVCYHYDPEGRLCSVKGQDSRVAELQGQEQNKVVTAMK